MSFWARLVPMSGTLTRCLLLGSVLLVSGGGVAQADPLRVAVASNFMGVATQLAANFEAEFGYPVTLISGSTGKHALQIQHGLSVDLVLAADVERPALLEQQGLTIPGTRFTYALGRLALWQPQAVSPGPETISHSDGATVALANPKLAPYGLAAQRALIRLDPAVSVKRVYGENVAQAYQFVYSGNAQLGLVAYAQVLSQPPTSYWLVPGSLHAPIEQQAVLLKETHVGRAFWRYLQSEKALELIREHGYDTP
ncbi:molybdate-binding periplasmic protein ModA [Arenicella chitinivorans]|uniref:Molybdate-binding periplasmic protein ModA n=1 Tax=Arenicella chitinivorans TaxID=1329800 RepID=A0A918RPS1_9GAMM|nr:molybdate ABC transporter substrate-binding protein [Arenicella chitinivorans]GHA04571.1 molybdate-binding periplasmic protein ModA [Arenicella chitinivorans]